MSARDDYPIIARQSRQRGTTQRAYYDECRAALIEITLQRAELVVLREQLARQAPDAEVADVIEAAMLLRYGDEDGFHRGWAVLSILHGAGFGVRALSVPAPPEATEAAP